MTTPAFGFLHLLTSITAEEKEEGWRIRGLRIHGYSHAFPGHSDRLFHNLSLDNKWYRPCACNYLSFPHHRVIVKRGTHYLPDHVEVAE